jgi:hypothetical protein
MANSFAVWEHDWRQSSWASSRRNIGRLLSTKLANDEIAFWLTVLDAKQHACASLGFLLTDDVALPLGKRFAHFA